MCTEVLRDSVFALYDIYQNRLNESYSILEAIRQTLGEYGKSLPKYTFSKLQQSNGNSFWLYATLYSHKNRRSLP